MTKALISMRGCAGWSAPLLFANPRRQVFSRRGPYVTLMDVFSAKLKKLKKDKVIENGDEEDEVSQVSYLRTPFCSR